MACSGRDEVDQVVKSGLEGERHRHVLVDSLHPLSSGRVEAAVP
jgi:hypothetical protein